MRIPKSFDIGGQTFTVKLDPNLAKREKLLGCIHYGTTDIVLQSVKRDVLSRRVSEEVFIHELVHALFDKTLDDESHTEATVSAFAGYLHQALTTMEYK